MRRGRVDNAASDEAAEAALEAGRLLFAGGCEFLVSAADENDLPQLGGSEVAFAGRSNVGKSSLLNALTERKTLARTSNTPGGTRLLKSSEERRVGKECVRQWRYRGTTD